MTSYIHHSEVERSMYPVGKSIYSRHYKFDPPYLHLAIYSIRFPPHFSAYSSKLPNLALHIQLTIIFWYSN
ncbi:hypothetical protein BDA96_03G397200 [Sorghum bicolor]|uniref:Uncharacterized protein n=2 Tax=Sorghum bicolor TaxID=4558 RepID=A0A921RIJ0_SORBI|nr:hypothetical protein BDA96_03G397200 [Sorghum bicolor]OQU87925.1 hypothetical protein SORBI_3003G368450 [Sorghum bicolor]